MKQKRIVFLSIILIFMVLGAIWLQLSSAPFFSYSDKVLGIYLVEDTVLEGKQKLYSDENPGIAFEMTPLPYDRESNTLYLSQSLNSVEWVGSLSLDLKDPENKTFYLCAPDAEVWNDKSFAIRNNHRYRLWAVSEKYYYELQLIITGTPIMAIQTERMTIPEAPTYEEDPDGLVYGSEPLYYGTVTVFDSDRSGEEYVITDAKVCYHEKGATSRTVSKKSYSIDLIDENELSVNVSLLGMRKDNSWKLNSLYFDPNRIREITASQIWESFDAADVHVSEPGPRMEYIELILDDEYQGLYCLVEPVDRKKLQLDSRDVLYKIIDWRIPDDDEMQDSANRGWRIMYPIRIRYPKDIADYNMAWYPVREYLQLFYRNASVDYSEGSAIIDIDNVIDYSLFLMTVSASDNMYKNTYLAAYHTDQGYIIYQIPWDLDYTFGNEYIYGGFPVRYNPDVSVIYMNEVMVRLHQANSQQMGELIWEKWSEYRNSFLDTEILCELIVSNRDYLLDTGAAEREINRWPDAQIDLDTEQILGYQRARMDWLDEFFYSWSE